MNQHKFAFRVGVLVLLIAVMAGVFSVRLHNVQITQAAEQDPTPSGSVTYHTRVTAARGEILDRNGNVLVGNRASYNLVIVREVLMSADAPNENLRRLVDLCSELGLEYTDHFPVTQEKPYAYVDSGSSLWDSYIRTFLTERGWDTDVSAPQLIRWLKEIYHLPADWTEEECRRVISLRYELDLRRYIGTLDTYVLMTDVDALSLAAITELNIPGLNVETSSVRQYNTTLAAHILGTIGKMDGTDWETYESKGYAMDAYIGKDGLERAFEEELHGSDGTRVTTITADGNILEEHYAVDPVAGNNIETTIDLGLQKVAEESLAAKILSLRENGVGASGNGKDAEGGAVVVMKVKTGEVLACASYPTYDLSTYNTNYNELAADPYKPFNNRALGLPYPPGSTYKMVTTIAAIDSGTISRWTQIEDEGVYTRFEDAGYMPRCMLYTTTGATHGLINVMEALAVSCNYYFYEAGYRTGITAIDNTAKALGLGAVFAWRGRMVDEPLLRRVRQMLAVRRVGNVLPVIVAVVPAKAEQYGRIVRARLQLPGELPEAVGRRANPETKKELYDEGHDGWYDADTVAASIGQSENRFTPLQLCSYTAALANRGVRYKATLLKRVLSSDYQELVLENQPVVASTLDISDEAYAAYSEGMREAVTSGTAYSAFVGYDVAVCAKTGTAQHGSGGSDNASFVLYAPADDPEIAIAIYVEKGAQGGTLGTIARDILTAYFSEAGSTDTVPAENALN